MYTSFSARMSTRSSRSYETPDSSDSEDGTYASPFPLEYEVPGDLSDVPPEIPEREPIELIPLQNAHPDESITDRHVASQLYTTLTHKHMPSVYSTPLRSTEFRVNTAITDSTFDITHLQSTTTINEDIDGPLKSHSRVKMMILLFLLLAFLIGMASLVVSLVAVFVTREGGVGDESVVTMEEMMALQEEVLELQKTIALMANQTSGSVNLTTFYESCQPEMKTRVCDTDDVEFSCKTGSLSLEKEVNITYWVTYISYHDIIMFFILQGYMTLDQSCYVIGDPGTPVTTTIISNRSSIRCHCHFHQGIGLDNGRMYSSVPMCVMSILHCPLQWNVTIDT